MPPATNTAAARPVAPTTRAPRMTLVSVVRKTNTGPLRILLHGTEGVGKTTFAAAAPDPIFLCPEDGIPRALGDVPHFPSPDDGWTWPDVIDAIRALAQGGHQYRTVVLDTLDWAEPLLWRWVCERAGVSSIEEVGGGFGKGYVAAVDGWRSLVGELEQLRRRTSMHVILLAHSWIKNFKDPESEGYDRYELKIHSKAAGLWKEWCDAVLFARHDDVVAKDARTKRNRGISTGARLIYTVHHAAYDAKNRFNLPEQLPLNWDEFAAAVESGRPAEVEVLRRVIEEHIGALSAEVAAKARVALERAGEDPARLAQVNTLVNAKLAAVGEKENG